MHPTKSLTCDNGCSGVCYMVHKKHVTNEVMVSHNTGAHVEAHYYTDQDKCHMEEEMIDG